MVMYRFSSKKKTFFVGKNLLIAVFPPKNRQAGPSPEMIDEGSAYPVLIKRLNVMNPKAVV